MKIFYFGILLLLPFQILNGQNNYADSLQKQVTASTEDSTKLKTWALLADYYSFLYPDSAMYYADTLIRYSQKNKNSYGEVLGYLAKGEAFDRMADFPSALQMAFNALSKSKELKVHKLYLTGKAYALIGHLNTLMGYAGEGREFFKRSLEPANESGEHEEEIYYTRFRIAFSYLMSGKMDSALILAEQIKAYLPGVKKLRNPTPWLIVGNIYKDLKVDSAEKYFREGLAVSEEFNALFIRCILYNMLGVVFFDKKQIDSSIYYVRLSLDLSQQHNYKLFEIGSSEFLAFIYDQLKLPDSSLKYMKIMVAAKDEAFGQTKLRQFQLVGDEDEKRQKELEKERIRQQNRVRLYGFIGILAFFGILSLVFWRNNKKKQIANRLLKSQNETIAHTLQDLKSTQAQLIQSAKMASLGELTAGIAHEIQNPLNFVNNFSEVNTELLGEMKEEIAKGNSSQAASLADSVFENEQKIIFHGKRAGAIVRGMLEHSRNNSGIKTEVNINELTDEYVRLAYHGLRAKDKSFNASLETDYDPQAGTISIVSQEIGRVILNLITNAFYAVDEKKKKEGEGYKPIVSFSTKRTGGKIELRIKDNGNGIPQNIKEKIFQPFFTTRPTGQGTGLGLSICYDIIKAHGGEINVDTKQGEGSEFIVQLPA